MTNKQLARGNATRQANKELRRQKILDIARDLIATQGLDDFTLKELATRAEVTLPTVHNLFGKKNDIVLELFRDLVARIDDVLAEPELLDPISSAEAFIDKLLEMYSADEAFYRAAFLGGERLGLFEQEMSDGIFKKSLVVAERLCRQAQLQGYLQGRVDTRWMAEQLFNTQRMARQDWVNGYIGLVRYRQQVLIGMLITFAADATADFHEQICDKIEQLSES
ncbi:MAG: helix-turn-helix domain-containing protein [Pseudomonadota bacterium]